MDTADQGAGVQRMEALARMAGGVAHDFNNLLTVILGYSELLIDRLPEDDDDTRPIVADIADAARRCRRITRDLMLFSGWQPVRPHLVSMADQITAVSSRLQGVIPAEVSLALSASDPSLRVVGDPEQLSDLLINLAVHAADAMRGGGTLRIEACRQRVEHLVDATGAAAEPGDYVRIRVSDTGAGIDAAMRDHLFEPFFTTQKAGKGAGLRLAAAFGIVKTCGGFLTVQSRAGEGSTIDVYLPFAQEPAVERQEAGSR